MGFDNMAFFTILTFLILIFCVTFSTFSVSAQSDNPPDINEDKVVIGQTFTLKENQELNGELAIIGGTVNLKPGSTVNGDIAIIGGAIEIEGTVNGDIQGLGGSINLLSTARISGSVYNFSTNLTREEGAVIEGQQIASLPFNLDFGDFTSPNVPKISNKNNFLGFIGNFLFAILQILALGAFAMVIVLIAPKSTDRIARSIIKQPFVHWGIGLLTFFAIPAVLIILIVTIILIPLGIIGILVFSFAILFGWLALGYAIGKRLFETGSGNYSPVLVAGLGTIILTTIARFSALIPCIGWTIGVLLSLFGLGAVILTRFGTRDYPVYETGTTQLTSNSSNKSPKSEEVGSILANIKSDLNDDLGKDEMSPDIEQIDPNQDKEFDGNGEIK